jgi:hypothetical protein
MGFKDKLIEFLEGKRDPLEKQLADADQGRFRCYLHGSLEELEGAFCYLYAGETSADLDNVFRGQQTVLTLTEAGIETGVVRWGRWGSGAVVALGDPASRTILWADVEKCIVEIGPERQLIFMIFADSTDEKRPSGSPIKNAGGQLGLEWIAIRIPEQTVRDIFFERFRDAGVTPTEHEGRVL